MIGDKEITLTCYASVSKEWQAAFERINFHRLTLRSCLKGFDRIVRRQLRGLVRDICLCIQESKTTSGRNGEITRRAIWKLFTILNTWKSEGDWSNCGLTLELNFHDHHVPRTDFSRKDSYFPYSESIDEYNFSFSHDLY